MKNQAGIDLANLSDAQKKMLVRLLAINNVEISHDKDSYFATLKVPTNDVNNYLNQQKGPDKKNTQNTIETVQLKKQQCALKQREQNKQKSMAKLQKKQATPTTPQKPKPKPQSKPVPASKKPLFKSIKLQPIARLQTLSPTIQIYIYPKRLPLLTIQQQIQQTYDQYWQISKTSSQANFVGCFYQVVCPFLGPGNKAKNDQSLVNTLESFHHFQFKEIGVRMFVRFMVEEMTKEQLAYFMVIRALLQQLFGQRILTHKPKSTTTSTSSQSNLTPSFSTPKLRLKWNPFTRQIPEPIVYSFLKITSQGPVDQKFERLTQHMYYCEQKKGNFIMYYTLIQFMLNQFERQCVSRDKNGMESMDRKSQSVDVDKLNLSYSQNDDSTLKDILLQYSCRTDGSRLKTKFQMELISEQSVDRVKEGCKDEFENDNILVETAIERGKDMCRRVQISPERQQVILQKIIYCVDSIRTMDKIKWVQAMQIEGTQEQLYFIEQLQMHYRNACTGNTRLTMVNNLVKRIFGGPGFIKLFSSSILF